MQDFRKIIAWQKSHALTLAVYKATEHFPIHELYGLTSQMRRSASSVPTNIAEGCGRDGKAELKRFLSIAMGSASELQYQLILANDLDYLPDANFQQLDNDVREVKRLLGGFIRSLSNPKN